MMLPHVSFAGKFNIYSAQFPFKSLGRRKVFLENCFGRKSRIDEVGF